MSIPDWHVPDEPQWEHDNPDFTPYEDDEDEDFEEDDFEEDDE